METSSLRHFSKGRLLRVFSALVGKDRGNTAELLAYIGEIDRRKLYLEHAYPSMFEFCTKRFRMSEAVAFKRIRAGRAACRFPCILGMVRRGELHLTGVHQLAGHLTAENYEEVLRRARHRSMREIEVLVAEIAPRRDAASMLRALPEQRAELAGSTSEQRGESCGGAAPLHEDLRGGTTMKQVTGQALNNGALSEASHARGLGLRGGNVAAPMRKPRNLATPLSPGRYKLQVTIGKEARDKLAELRNLLSHQIPDGDLAAVIERALDLLLAETKKTKAALVGKPRTKREKGALLETRGVKRKEDALMREAGGKRHEREAGAEHNGKSGRTRAIPAQVRRAVFARDDGRCAFVDDEGRRCGSGWQVEFHHCVPYARGGLHGAENVELRCRAHNQYEAELEYGELFMSSVARTRRPGG